ncbi:hypothetical protein Tco_0321018 [Tanacetum coccineum]
MRAPDLVGVTELSIRRQAWGELLGTSGKDDEEVSEGGFQGSCIRITTGAPDLAVAPNHKIYIQALRIHKQHCSKTRMSFPTGEQPLPPIDSPTAESPGYVTELDPEEDLEEYEDNETEDGPVDYPIDGGDDGDDEDGDSSRDDACDKDEDEEDEEG